MTEISTLIKVLEDAMRGSDVLDKLIARACCIQWSPDEDGQFGGYGIMPRRVRFTTSIEAAFTLVPADASSWDCGRIDKDFLASVEFAVDVDGFHNYHAKSPASAAIALCIAALKAHASLDPRQA